MRTCSICGGTGHDELHRHAPHDIPLPLGRRVLASGRAPRTARNSAPTAALVRGAPFFGNTTNWITIDEPHAILDILAESRVSIEPIPAYAPDASMRWENVRTAFE